MDQKNLDELTYRELVAEETLLFTTYRRVKDPMEKAEHLEYMARVIRQQVTGPTKLPPKP